MYKYWWLCAPSCADVLLYAPILNDEFFSYPEPTGIFWKPFSTTGNDMLGKENQALRNEIEELKNKLQKVSDDLSKRIQLNLYQANMMASSVSKWKLRGKFKS